MAVLTNELDFVGKEIPLGCVKGALIVIGFEVVDKNNQPVDISTRTYTAKIGPRGGPAAASFTYIAINALLGLGSLTLNTATVDAGDYRWIAWENATNFLWHGPVTIIDPDVT